MRLPEGKTCGDCAHIVRCKMIFGVKPENTVCDFFPKRFHLRVVEDDKATA